MQLTGGNLEEEWERLAWSEDEHGCAHTQLEQRLDKSMEMIDGVKAKGLG